MKILISVCFFLTILFLFNGCYAIYFVDDSNQRPICGPPIPHPPPITPIIIDPAPAPPPVCYPPAVIIEQPEPTTPDEFNHRDIRIGHGPVNQNPATAPSDNRREIHTDRNPVVSNPSLQTNSETATRRDDNRDNTSRPVRDSGVKRSGR